MSARVLHQKKPRDRSLRGRGGRSRGKQPGAQSSLRQIADPDEIVVYAPGACGQCGADLAGAAVTGAQKLQESEIVPPPPPKVTEYQVQAGPAGGAAPSAPDKRRPAWYRGAAAKGITGNQGKRRKTAKDGLRLARRFRDNQDIILRFATDLAVGFTSNQADMRGPRLCRLPKVYPLRSCPPGHRFSALVIVQR